MVVTVLRWTRRMGVMDQRQEKYIEDLETWSEVKIMRMMIRILVRVVMVRMPAAGSLGGATRPISRAITDQVDLKYYNTR